VLHGLSESISLLEAITSLLVHNNSNTLTNKLETLGMESNLTLALRIWISTLVQLSEGTLKPLMKD
jgi:hypothetical protein